MLCSSSATRAHLAGRAPGRYRHTPWLVSARVPPGRGSAGLANPHGVRPAGYDTVDEGGEPLERLAHFRLVLVEHVGPPELARQRVVQDQLGHQVVGADPGQ